MTELERRTRARDRGISLWLAGTRLAPGIVAGLKPIREMTSHTPRGPRAVRSGIEMSFAAPGVCRKRPRYRAAM